MKHKISTEWIGGMAFETDFEGHKVTVDAHEQFGGKNLGPLPKPLLLNALTGCTSMDVMSILNKMQVEPEAFRIDVEATMTETHPKVYSDIHLVYVFKGKDLPENKLEKAVKLSQEKYCGVSAMLEKACNLTYEIKVEE